MKKYSTLLYILLLCSVNVVSQNLKSTLDDSTATMTYLGGSGFLLESPNKKVIIDGIFTSSGAEGFMIPSSKVLTSIYNSYPPFNNIDLFLVGHSHGDHFDGNLMNKCMKNNTKAVLVCQADCITELKKVTGSAYENYKNRIFIPTVTDFKSIDTVLNGINLRVTKFPSFGYHPNGILVFNVILNNIKFLHLLGPRFEVQKYSGSFNDADNDILLVGNDYLDNTTLLESSLKYKIAYINHIYNYSASLNTYVTRSKTIREKGLEVYVFQATMEKYKFVKTGNKIRIDTLVYTSIKQTKNNEIGIWPNPTNGKIHINSLKAGNNKQELNIFDNSGRMVINRKIRSNDDIVDLSILSMGSYLLVINEYGKKIYEKTIIMKK